MVLNVLLWLALLVSIPRGGFRPLYVTAAIVGVVVLSLFAALVVLLMKGREPAERITRNIARTSPRSSPTRRWRCSTASRTRCRRSPTVPTWCAVASAGPPSTGCSTPVRCGCSSPPSGARAPRQPARVLRAGERAGGHPAHPGGLGVVEAVLTSTLVGFGVDAAVAAVGVVTYRLAAFWLPIPLGAFSYATLRYGPVPLAQTREQLKPLALEAFSDGGALTVD